MEMKVNMFEVFKSVKAQLDSANIYYDTKAYRDDAFSFLVHVPGEYWEIDVREDGEFARDHLPGATHIGKGVIERDVEQAYPALDTELVLYCGGGYRSALAAENLMRMGYTNIISLAGGYRAWKDRGLPLVTHS